MKKITFLFVLFSIFFVNGQELITSGGFENLTTGNVANTTALGVWASTTSANTQIQKPSVLTNVHTGEFSVNLGNDFANLRQYFTSQPNVEYTVSFWYKMNFTGVDAADAPFVSIRTQAGPANGNGTIINTFSFQLDAAANTWTNFTFTFITPETNIQFFVFSPARNSGGVNNSVRFDDVGIVPSSTLSLDEFSVSQTRLYPNPAQNEIILSANQIIEKVEIYNLVGQKILDKTTNQKEVNVQISDLSSGVYLLKSHINGNVKTQKFIKN